MRKSLKCLIVPFALILGGACLNPAAGQTITPPGAYEFTFNKAKMQYPVQTSNYSIKYVIGTAHIADFYISAWSTHAVGGNSEVIYTFTAPVDPTMHLSQGSIILKDASDIEVGYYSDINLGPAVAIAYYEKGVGHKLDIYRITNPAAPTLSYDQTILLSGSSQYGRIRMDSHFRYGIAVVWENPTTGAIETLVGQNGNWGPIIPLSLPGWPTMPDVAFSHPDNDVLNLHYVYKDNAAQTLNVSRADFTALQAGINTTTTVDVLPIQGHISKPVIDCPDHYNKETWAYTFTNGNQVFVRHKESNFMAVPKTTIVNNGSLGNVPTVGKNRAYNPTLHYGDGAYNVGGYTAQIHVGWYNIDNVQNGNFDGQGRYIGVEMNTTGTSLISDPDYMGISQNAQDVLPDTYSGIAFSKMGEGHWGDATRYMYTTYFSETAPGNGDYELHHAFHKWPDTRFRGSNTPPPPHPDCGQHLPVAKTPFPATEMNVYPNPFKSTLTNNVTMNAEGLFELTLTDINGRQVGSKQIKLNKGRHMVEMSNLGHLAPGTYFLSSFIDGKINGTKTVVKQ